MRALVLRARAAQTQEGEGNTETDELMCGVTLRHDQVECVRSRPNMATGFSERVSELRFIFVTFCSLNNPFCSLFILIGTNSRPLAG